MIDNPDCDGPGPHSAGHVALLRLSSAAVSSQLHLCPRCWAAEMAWRLERNADLALEARFDILDFPEAQ